MTTTIQLETLYQHDFIADIDWYFARFIQNLATSEDNYLGLAAALASYEIRAGHSCADLAQLAEQAPWSQALDVDVSEEIQHLHYPAYQTWLAALQACDVIGQAGEFKPLILVDSRLYLYRYWWYEQHIATNLYQRTQQALPAYDATQLKVDIARLFPTSDAIDWQQLAAMTAVLQHLSIISGGPGTGKTTTVVKVLALLLGQNPDLRIALAAPTGKAAMRLQSSIMAAKQDLPADVGALIPQQAQTLHRLLGVKKHSPHFRHNAQQPLALDVLLIDEVSMIDLALMSKLLQALPTDSRLILLGDKDQLSSVEAGSVLESICSAGADVGFSSAFAATMQALLAPNLPAVPIATQQQPLQDQVVVLQKSYRFSAESSLGQFALAVNQGDVAAALAVLQQQQSDVRCYPRQVLADLSDLIVEGFRAYLQADDIAGQLQGLQDFKILCAYRQSESGVIQTNQFVRQLLQERGLINVQGRWYAGQPILITRNDYQHQLFNGDTGIIAPIPESPQQLGAFFPDAEGGLRYLAPNRLPEHEEAYAMTIHKSQGSEFKQVLMVLPAQSHPLLDRSLLYTGLTRARQQVGLLATHQVLGEMIGQRSPRHGGLEQAFCVKE